ncbi:MAG: hypothetical protein R6X32_09575 [Chloroflexota bacterium]
MKTANQPQSEKQKTQSERLPYEMPAVIHESLITTRAGTPFGNPDDNNAVDPADLFGS